MWAKQKAFTIVELLIVIVVIAILAAITVVAYNGIQSRARTAAVSADFSNNIKVVQTSAAINGSASPLTVDVNATGNKLVAATRLYKLSSYCSSAQGFVLAAETTNGDKYYSLNGAPSVQNNAIDAANPCPGQGITPTGTIFAGMPVSACAGENGTCTFGDTSSIAYGSLVRGQFVARKDLASPVGCTNAFFTDPAPGYAKSCYVLSY